MFKSPWFTLILGLMLGLGLGYVLAERQPVPPARALALAAGQGAGGSSAVPPDHPPVAEGAAPAADSRELATQAQDPRSVPTLTALGNLYFDHSRWPEAKGWYERSLELKPDDTNVLTDLAVVNRNLGKYDEALRLLDRALGLDGHHWQALYNKVIVLHFDLHKSDQARAALQRLETLRADHPEIPDMSKLKAEISGGR